MRHATFESNPDIQLWPNPFPTDDDDKSTDYGSVPADYEWE
jgi:hypothetical protein